MFGGGGFGGGFGSGFGGGGFGGGQALQNSQDQQRLMDEGMTCAESANAIDAARKEGRRVGSAAEERQRVLDRAAKERRARALSGSDAVAIEPGIKNVLVIDGTAMSSDFMTEHLLMIEKPPTPGFYEMPPSTEAKRASEAAWRGIKHERVGLEGGERPDRLELCRRAILSGRFHAIILSDLSENDRAVPAVETELGATLQAFARGGGAIAVTTCDSAMVLEPLKRMFGVCWKQGGYYRTTWGPARENREGVTATFPAGVATGSFSAKAHAVRGVPEAERMFGTQPNSRSQSMVPMFNGRDVGTREDSDSVAAGAVEDYDVVIAKHIYGAGSLALFCDINMEQETVQRVLGYCKQSSKESPPDAVARLAEAAYSKAMALKAEGNAAFGKQDFVAATAKYEAALAEYGEQGGATGEQREEKVKLCSNLAECRLKAEAWEAAAAAASEALSLAPAHAKSLVRHAKAAEKLGAIEVAEKDLRRVIDGAGDANQRASAAALLRPLQAKLREGRMEEKRREDAANAGFRAGFAGALGGSNQRNGSATPAEELEGSNRPRVQGMPPMADVGANMQNAAWARGLSKKDQLEWLVDCYRMRVDDDATWGGGFYHGLYAKQMRYEDNPGDGITEDFLVFCKLAVKHGAIPAGWDWPAYLETAAALLQFAFEKEDAKEKWGGENVFAAFMGGRSLRATGEVVYSNSCQAMEPSSEMEQMEEICRLWQSDPSVCASVGGTAGWKVLARALGEGGDSDDAMDIADPVASTSQPPPKPPDPPTADMIPLKPQERVRVCGLSGRPELNDALATTLMPMDASTGRYCVRVRRQLGSIPQIDDVKLKRSNLTAMPIPTVEAREAPDGFHAIHDAAVEGRAKVVEQHLKSGIDPDLLDSDGWTALMRACLWAHAEVVQILLAHGATPDIPAGKTGSTALHFVCMHGPRNRGPTGHYDVMRHKLTAESLLAYGAQKNLGNAKGETPSMWARERGATEILAMLS